MLAKRLGCFCKIKPIILQRIRSQTKGSGCNISHLMAVGKFRAVSGGSGQGQRNQAERLQLIKFDGHGLVIGYPEVGPGFVNGLVEFVHRIAI